jgi:hypothetical protein
MRGGVGGGAGVGGRCLDGAAMEGGVLVSATRGIEDAGNRGRGESRADARGRPWRRGNGVRCPSVGNGAWPLLWRARRLPPAHAAAQTHHGGLGGGYAEEWTAAAGMSRVNTRGPACAVNGRREFFFQIIYVTILPITKKIEKTDNTTVLPFSGIVRYKRPLHFIPKRTVNSV